MFVESVQSSILKSLRHWYAENQDGLLEYIKQKGGSVLDLQGRKAQR